LGLGRQTAEQPGHDAAGPQNSAGPPAAPMFHAQTHPPIMTLRRLLGLPIWQSISRIELEFGLLHYGCLK
jgi:hypothetical protein